MAQVRPKWWGVVILLTHAEACLWTSGTVNNLGRLIAQTLGGPWGVIVTEIVIIHKSYIRWKTQNSGGQGVRLKFTWAGIYIGCERRGTGSSPCP